MNREFDHEKSQCEELINAFAYYVDHREFERAVALFVPEGRFIRPDTNKEGHAQIASLWADRPEQVVTRHLAGAPFFLSVSESQAQSITQVTIYQATKNDDGQAVVAGPIGVAEFCDLFINTEDGWKFEERKVVPAIIQAQ